jgi:hypothetical protein
MRTMTQGLTDTERRVYEAAIALIKENEFGPTFLEIAQRRKCRRRGSTRSCATWSS